MKLKNKRKHTGAKLAGITQIGCEKSFLEALRNGLKAASNNIGKLLRPREVLCKFDGFKELFCDLAKAVGMGYGGNLHITFTQGERRGAWKSSYNGKAIISDEEPAPVKITKQRRENKTSKTAPADRSSGGAVNLSSSPIDTDPQEQAEFSIFNHNNSYGEH